MIDFKWSVLELYADQDKVEKVRYLLKAEDADGNEVAYDLQTVIAQAETDLQAVIDTKASALSKLAALGLTEDEVKALVG